MTGAAKVISCSSAQELLEHLSPLRATWPEKHFVFRGQPDADYGLEASAHRLNGRITAPNKYGSKDIHTLQQVAFEASVVRRFLEGCDLCGLLVPGDTYELRHRLENAFVYAMRPGEWPPREMHPVLAVAQHHGVPTCLLDWSWRSYVAAYFAASSALGMEKMPSFLAIWALDVSPEARSEWKGLELVKLAGGTSANLAAQAGLFTVSRITQEPTSTFIPTPLSDRYPHHHGVKLAKYTLPTTQAAALLKACAQLGVSASTLFPGYDGVAKEVLDIANSERRPVDMSVLAARDL